MLQVKSISHWFIFRLFQLADVQFLPLSGLVGSNMKTRVEKGICPWWNGPCLLEVLDGIEVPQRDPKGLLRYYVLSSFMLISQPQCATSFRLIILPFLYESMNGSFY